MTAIGCLGLTSIRWPDPSFPIGTTEPHATNRWHPLTRSLLDRARLAGDRPDKLRVERTVRELADVQGRASRPVMKWMDNPTDAFDHLSRYGLDALLDMESANFWRGLDVLERSFDLRWLAAEILRVDDWDRALMAPKLSAKSDAVARGASAGAIFEVRAVAAQKG